VAAGFTKDISCLTNLVTFTSGVTASVAKQKTTDVIYMDFFTSFNMVPHNILAAKLERLEFDRWTARWIRNWMDVHVQRVAVNGSMSKWKAVMSGVPQGYVQRPILFKILINDIEDGIEYTLSKFADDTKLGGAGDTLEGRDAVQRDLDRLREWAQTKLMKFNKVKCKFLHPGKGNSHYQYRLGDEWIGSNPLEKDLGILVDKNLVTSWQCVLAAQKALHILGYM